VLLREGLGRLFADAGHEVVASLGNADGLLRAVVDRRPDLVVLDIRMPPTFTDEGAQAARDVKQAHPGLGVLVPSQHVETRHAVTLVQLGGFGDLLKDRVLDVGEFLATAERVVEAHVRHVLMKLDIPDSENGHRRVLAVLTHLSARQDASPSG
jgi:DNA-binding NtrC family response regulator